MAVFNTPNTTALTQGSFEGSARKIISRTRIVLTGVANPFKPAQYARLRELNSLLQSPLYETGGLNLLRSLDRRTFREYNRLSKAFVKATTSKRQPGFVVIQRSVQQEYLPFGA